MLAPRFKFGLRTLFVGVALVAALCAYVGREAKIVEERWAMIRQLRETRGLGSVWPDDKSNGSWLRRALGDREIRAITVHEDDNLEEMSKLLAIFPEAKLEPSWGRPNITPYFETEEQMAIDKLCDEINARAAAR